MFELGSREVSPEAQRALENLGVDPHTLLERHGHGDWGDAPDWCQGGNAVAAEHDRHAHAITSQYRLSDEVEVIVVTAVDRSRTRLQLTSEYHNREVSSREGYAHWAPAYDGGNFLIDVEEPFVRALLIRLLPVETAVDIGTGTGRHAVFLAQHGANVVGFDDSPDMLTAARRKAAALDLNTVRFEQATLGTEPLPAASDTYDLLTCALMLTHVPDLEGAAGECARLVRRGAHLVVSDFHPSVAHFGWRVALGTPDAWLGLPHAPHTREGYVRALETAGCDVLEIHDLDGAGNPYGDVSPEAMTERGTPPVCLVVLARKA